MIIREANNADFDRIWPIFHAIVARGDTYAYPTDVSWEEGERLWMQVPRKTFVAEEGGAILGTYYIKTNQAGPGAHVCNCGYMVAEAARGRGIATALCEHSQAVARELGYQAMQFNFVAASNTGAVRLWRHLGFEVVGRLPGAFRHPRRGNVDALLMFKTLGNAEGDADSRIKPAALLVIDVQLGFNEPGWGTRNNPHAEANIACLIAAWRERGGAVIHVRHCSEEPDSPLRPDRPGNGFKPEARPWDGEKIISKTVNSAFIGTDLEAHLRDQGITDLVIVGLTTDHCVSTTTRMAGNLGFSTVLVSDATATFSRPGPDGLDYTAEEIHRVHLASLHGEFCTVRTTEAVLEAVQAESGW